LRCSSTCEPVSCEFDADADLLRWIPHAVRKRFQVLCLPAPDDAAVAVWLRAEGLILVRDAVLDAVLLDKSCGLSPLPASVRVLGRNAKRTEVGRWVGDVGVDELGQAGIERGFDAGETIEFVAMFGDVLVPLAALRVEAGIGSAVRVHH
jgi:hypothetical protein